MVKNKKSHATQFAPEPQKNLQVAPELAVHEMQNMRAIFRNLPKKVEMANHVALFGFSLSHEYHTGKALQAIFLLAQECGLKIENTIFLLGDRLQVYNLAARDIKLNPDSQEAITKADEMGVEWISNNAETLQGIALRRWGEFVDDTGFLEEKSKLSILYDETSTSGKIFRKGIDKTADDVLERFTQRGAFPDEERAKKLFVRFVLEECALFSHLAKKHTIGYMAYPSAMPSSMDVTKRYIINNDQLLKWVQIKIHSLNVKDNNTPHKTAPMVHQKPNEVSCLHRHNESLLSSGSETNSSSSDEEEPEITQQIAQLRKLLRCLIIATADGLVQTGQLPNHQKDRVVNGLLKNFDFEVHLNSAPVAVSLSKIQSID